MWLSLSDLWSIGCWPRWRCWLRKRLDRGQLANLVPSICSTAHIAELSTILCEQFNEIWILCSSLSMVRSDFFFVNTNSIAANQNLYKWLLTPSGAASCDNKQFGFLGDQNALCGNPRRTLNANPSHRQIHLMSSRQNIYQQSTQTGCNTPCVCCSGYVRNAHACYCVHCDHCCAWKASPVSGLVTLWEADQVTCVPLRFFSTTACCDHNHVLLFKPVSKTLITGSSK